MIASRWMPSPTPSSAKVPCESGPRCSITSHIRRTSAASTGPRLDTFPAIPHISVSPRRDHRDRLGARAPRRLESGARKPRGYVLGALRLVVGGDEHVVG